MALTHLLLTRNFPSAAATLQAARDGCGIAVGTSILCADDLRRGALLKLLDIEVVAPNPYFVIKPGLPFKGKHPVKLSITHNSGAS
ncbi:hypothetical protein FE249_20160 (plasmid) [Acidiphilium multivorum]|uniref:hypothetical protein n=1 Tax=Acidiphilium multivorum TaxID=62140 RepID=UPI001F4BD412|nr:hypothetical protein [Acidiphilium multivorum]UNC16502.1 hypothetical protein FE249_20160 [Acidiphilium multivorum]